MKPGYSRPTDTLPFFGFDGVPLKGGSSFAGHEPSWWDAKNPGIKLRELNANTVLMGPLWSESPRSFGQVVRQLRATGVRVIVQVTEATDWREGSEFVTKKAAWLLAQARNQGVGELADMIVIEGDAASFANQSDRRRMYRLAKEYFAATPVVRRYGPSLEWAEAMEGRPHPMGGVWDDYRFGPDECDVALIEIGRGVPQGATGVKIGAALEQLNHLVALVKSRQPEAAVLVGARFGDAKQLDSRRDAMWNPKAIEQFISSVLTSTAVEGLLFQGLGEFRYDLARAEFAAQRQAVRDGAPPPHKRGLASELR